MDWKFGLCFIYHEAHLSMQGLFIFLDSSVFIESLSEISYFQLHDLMQFDLSQFLLHMLDHLGQIHSTWSTALFHRLSLFPVQTNFLGVYNSAVRFSAEWNMASEMSSGQSFTMELGLNPLMVFIITEDSHKKKSFVDFRYIRGRPI